MDRMLEPEVLPPRAANLIDKIALLIAELVIATAVTSVALTLAMQPTRAVAIDRCEALGQPQLEQRAIAALVVPVDSSASVLRLAAPTESYVDALPSTAAPDGRVLWIQNAGPAWLFLHDRAHVDDCLELAQGRDETFAPGTEVVFVRDGAAWHEVSRADP
jgi:hypothetical protein